MTNQTGYIVYATDSVGTALGEIEPGAIRLLGEPGDGHVTAAGHIPFGHKFALRALREGLLTSAGDYGRPWFGQLMAGPQMLAYLVQLNVWMERFHLTV